MNASNSASCPAHQHSQMIVQAGTQLLQVLKSFSKAQSQYLYKEQSNSEMLYVLPL